MKYSENIDGLEFLAFDEEGVYTGYWFYDEGMKWYEVQTRDGIAHYNQPPLY